VLITGLRSGRISSVMMPSGDEMMPASIRSGSRVTGWYRTCS
jgi:hypothetical protein